MTAKQAKKLKRGDRVIQKNYASDYMHATSEETTVEYVSFNPDCGQYFIATTDGWGAYHKRMKLVTT